MMKHVLQWMLCNCFSSHFKFYERDPVCASVKISQYVDLTTLAGLIYKMWYGVALDIPGDCITPFFFSSLLPNDRVSVLSQARCKEHHSDTLYSEDPGSQPCAKVAAQGFGHCAVWSAPEYVTYSLFFSFFFINSCCST